MFTFLGAGFLASAAVVFVGANLSDTIQRWWWMVLAVGVVATLAEVLLPVRSQMPAAPSAGGQGSAIHYDPAAAGAPPESGLRREAGIWGGEPHVQPDAGREFDTVRASDVREVVLPPVPEQGAQGPDQPGPQAGSPPRSVPAVDPMNAPALLRPSPVPDHAVWRSDALWIPKSSHSDTEHEDAWAIDDTAGSAALSDGASSAFMARSWARTITSRYVEDPPEVSHGSFVRWVDRATQLWMESTGDPSGDGSWWAGESEKRGSFATLVGLSVAPIEPVGPGAPEGLAFTAVAVGDTCLVHLSPDGAHWKRIMSFPIDEPDAFGKHPELVASSGARSDGSFPVLRAAAGQLRRGDALLLATDALAEFALGVEAAPGEDTAWDWLMRVSQDEFAHIVARSREVGRIEDDDTTLLRLRF